MILPMDDNIEEEKCFIHVPYTKSILQIIKINNNYSLKKNFFKNELEKIRTYFFNFLFLI